MTKNGISITQLFTHYSSLGGVEAVVKSLQRLEDESPYRIQTLIHFENDSPNDAYSGLGLKWLSTINSARRHFQKLMLNSYVDGIFLYHNIWGLNFLYDLDRSTRRIGLLHSLPAECRNLLASCSGKLDGLMCVSRPLLDEAKRNLPELAQSGRLSIFPLPIRQPSPLINLHTTTKERPQELVFGYSGRVCFKHKRVDLIPALLSEISEHKLQFRFEILGEGPALGWLKQRLRNFTNVTYHGRQTGDRYWQILSNWDAIAFFSDCEGLPLSLLEALSRGVIPIFPKIGCGGDDYVAQISSKLLYEQGNLSQMARVIEHVSQLALPEISQIRQIMKKLVLPHLNTNYIRTFESFVDRVSNLPRISGFVGKRRLGISDHLPFALIQRFYQAALYR